MKEFEARHEGRGIVGRKLCGCIVAVNLGYTDRERQEMEAEYVVSEHTHAEARELFNGFDHNSCLHGPAEAQLMAEVKKLERERAEIRAENDRLRAALANSPGACVYCQLPKEQWATCRSGFPGCARADDAMGCPELGATMELHQMAGERTLLVRELENIANAKPREWGEMADQFQPWAQSRARHVLGLVNSAVREWAKAAGAVMNPEGRKTGKDA